VGFLRPDDARTKGGRERSRSRSMLPRFRQDDENSNPHKAGVALVPNALRTRFIHSKEKTCTPNSGQHYPVPRNLRARQDKKVLLLGCSFLFDPPLLPAGRDNNGFVAEREQVSAFPECVCLQRGGTSVRA